MKEVIVEVTIQVQVHFEREYGTRVTQQDVDMEVERAISAMRPSIAHASHKVTGIKGQRSLDKLEDADVHEREVLGEVGSEVVNYFVLSGAPWNAGDAMETVEDMLRILKRRARQGDERAAYLLSRLPFRSETRRRRSWLFLPWFSVLVQTDDLIVHEGMLREARKNAASHFSQSACQRLRTRIWGSDSLPSEEVRIERFLDELNRVRGDQPEVNTYLCCLTLLKRHQRALELAVCILPEEGNVWYASTRLA